MGLAEILGIIVFIIIFGIGIVVLVVLIYFLTKYLYFLKNITSHFRIDERTFYDNKSYFHEDLDLNDIENTNFNSNNKEDSRSKEYDAKEKIKLERFNIDQNSKFYWLIYKDLKSYNLDFLSYYNLKLVHNNTTKIIDFLLLTNRNLYIVKICYDKFIDNDYYLYGNSENDFLEVYNDQKMMINKIENPKKINEENLDFLKEFLNDQNLEIDNLTNIVIFKDNLVNYCDGEFKYYDFKYAWKQIIQNEVIYKNDEYKYDVRKIRKIKAVLDEYN